MKTKIFSLMFLAAACVGLTSCSDDNWNPGGNKSDVGSLSLESMAVDVNTVEDTHSRAAVNTDSYLVEITNKTTGASEGSFVYGTMPEVVTLTEGDYTVSVKSHEVKDAEWSAPYYVGDKDFTITAGKITEIGTVLCKFSNIKVTVRYTAELAKMLGDDANVRVVANDNGTLDFKRDETRSGYFAALEGSSTLVAHFTAEIDGNPVEAIKTFTDIAAGQHHIITFSVKNGSSTIPDEFGKVDPAGINIDVNIEHEDVSGNVTAEEDNKQSGNERPGKEEWPEEPGPGPDQPGPDQPGTDEITFKCETAKLDGTPNTIEDGAEYKVDIHADKGINELWVTIESTNDGFKASAGELLPLNFDLAHLDDATYENLKSIGLEGNEAVLGKTDVPFEITDLVPLLSAFQGTHSFIIRVVPAEGEEKSVTLTFEVK